MLAAALEAEVDAYLAAHAAERDERGRREDTIGLAEFVIAWRWPIVAGCL